MPKNFHLTENDVRELAREVSQESFGAFAERLEDYVKKAVFDAVIAEWKPYIHAVKWMVTSVLIAFGAGLIALVFTSLQK